MDPEVLEDWAGKMRGLMACVGLLFAVLLLRLFYLQITTAADYAKESEDNRIAQKRIKAPRGLILDRDGEVLARNRAAFSILLIRGSREGDARAIAALEAAIGEPVRYSSRQRAVRLKRDVDFQTVAIVEERLRGDGLSLLVETEPQRQYPNGPLAAHVTGYMGELQEDELEARGRRYVAGDYIGKTGLERAYEDSLRGVDGVSYVEVDALDRIKNEHPFPDRERAPVPGSDLRLTIDLDLQRAALDALPDSLAGSVVALDPRTGAVLALVSHPTFDPNAFVSYGQQEERRGLFQDPLQPMLNRAIRGTYAPGSTLKMVAAVAALETGVTDTLSTFEACSGAMRMGDVTFRCAKRDGHGELNLLQAIERSCNIYFNHLAQVLGVEAWHEYGVRFGFGQPTGIDIEPRELVGLLPSRKWYAEREGWSAGHLMNLAIGQGAMLVTPVQMARYVAALANGGYLVTPHLHGQGPPPVRIGISESALDIVRRGMHRVVYGDHGTGRRLQIPGIDMAGKSGTAQGPRPGDDAWFVAFAPYDEPQIAVAVVIEGGGGGGAVAAPVAREVIRAYFEDLRRRSPIAGPGPGSGAVATTPGADREQGT